MVTLLHVPNKILGEIVKTWGKGQKMASGNVNSLSTWPPKLRVATGAQFLSAHRRGVVPRWRGGQTGCVVAIISGAGPGY